MLTDWIPPRDFLLLSPGYVVSATSHLTVISDASADRLLLTAQQVWFSTSFHTIEFTTSRRTAKIKKYASEIMPLARLTT